MLLLDEELASAGTINFDNRSFRINFEVTLLMMDDEIIRQCHEQMLRDFADAVEDPPDPLAQQKFPLRLAARGARLLSPLL
jgi:cardiolipin synthase